ncbi:hypothetical protein EPICR_30315 [Candidatus Desulfarcum epimagneticum]|uniref:Uncharacterized protein n=1 Tax=uncultured Desulfobacteraceae bacterium TaxID=218296 RepID=A0A484HJG7_9BACT|nr:hypothetical protein EPICR_30315 [uncultured Desulfobacteraceae bacterium]
MGQGEQTLADDDEDIAAFDESADEPLISYEEMISSLKREGRFPLCQSK